MDENVEYCAIVAFTKDNDPTCAINGCCLSKPPQSWCYVAEAEEDDAL